MHSKIWQLIRPALTFGAKIISPPFCEECRCFLSERSLLCFECKQKIMPVMPAVFAVGTKYQLLVYAAGAYEAPLKGLVLAKNRSYNLAARYLAEQIYERTPFMQLPCDYLVPIPLHWTRELWRGYNQGVIIAKRLEQLHPQVQLANILERRRITAYQSGLSKSERATNLQSAFNLCSGLDFSLYQGKDLILIDDVATSGATLINAAKELAKLNPKSISALVACRTI